MKTRKTWILIVSLLLASACGCGEKGPDANQAAVGADDEPDVAANPDVETINQAAAIAMIEMRGGKVKRNLKHPDQPVINIKFSGCRELTDADLVILKGLTQLQRLDLSGTQVTDAGLEHIKGLTQLHTLWLNDTQVTDVGVEHLKGLTKLWMLSLHSTKVTDVSVEHLKGLTKLRELNLYNTKMSDAGLEKLKKALPKCYIKH